MALWSSNPERRQDRDADREKVRDASDIVRIVGECVSLKPKGREYTGLCPFHDDHKPSMNVVPSKQIFHCFVCGAGGDVFSFVQKFHKMEFPEALRYLAERANITLSKGRPGPAEAGSGRSRQDLLGACAMATEFFRGVLAHPDHGGVGRDIIARRGITAVVAEQFLVGASPQRWDGLVLTAQSKGLDLGVFVEAGLLKAREQGNGFYDVLRHRLIFPIQDQAGRVIAFGGRRLNDEDEPKYLNSPETRLFKKSETLYALNHAARTIQTKRTAIITEGYTDAIACHQAGVTNAVATLGTALTREHAGLLRRLCDRVVLLFDGDDAGKRAADRAVDVFFSEPLDVQIATLSRFTDAKDPDELLKRKGGLEVFDRAVANARDVLRYRFDRLHQRLAGAGVAALSKAVEEELAWLAARGLAEVSPVRQRLIIRQLAGIAQVDEATITRMLPSGRQGRAEGPRSVVSDPEGDEAQALAIQRAPLSARDHLLGCILCDGTLYGTLPPDARDLTAPVGYRFPLFGRLAQCVHDLAGDGVNPDLAAVLAACDADPVVQQVAVSLASRVDVETDRDSTRLRSHWSSCLLRAQRDVRGGQGTPTADDVAGVLEAIRKKRAVDSTLGADRRVMPRPG